MIERIGRYKREIAAAAVLVPSVVFSGCAAETHASTSHKLYVSNVAADGQFTPVRTVTKPVDIVLGAGEKYLETMAADLFVKTNEYRASRGIAPLVENTALKNAARDYARVMAENSLPPDKFWQSHTGPDGSSHIDRMKRAGFNGIEYGENYVYMWGTGGSWTADNMLDWWKNSPPHNAALLNGRFKEVGMACFEISENQWNWVYCVQDFGTK